MKILDVVNSGTDYLYKWPSGNQELYAHWIDYGCSSGGMTNRVRIGFGDRKTYGANRKRVVIWIDGHPHAEFLAADDFGETGDVLCEIKVPGNVGERMCKYPSETVPDCYSDMRVVGLPTRVSGPKVHNAWAVVANISDHKVMIALAVQRAIDRDR